MNEGEYKIKINPIGDSWRHSDNLEVEISILIDGKERIYKGICEVVL